MMVQNNHLIDTLKNTIDGQCLCIDRSSFSPYKAVPKTDGNRVGYFKDAERLLVGK
jgi:hypothetical protein